MGIWIQRRRHKKSDGTVTESWRLVVDDYSGQKKIATYPERKNYPKYGLRPDDPIESAQTKLKALQAKNKVDRIAEKRSRIEKRLERAMIAESAFLPRALYDAFLDWLKERRLWDEIPEKTESHLRCLQRIVLEINIDPSELSDKPEKVYHWFLKQKLSLSYIDKVLPLLNEYGYFYCRAFSRPFLPLSLPRGEIARRIEDANLDDRDGKGAESKPMTRALIRKLEAMPPEQYRWMRASFYLGLRPAELDRIGEKSQDKLWKVVKDGKKTPILNFYQSKITKVSRERRWKRIPCILSEQREILAEIQSGLPMKRPYVYAIQDRLGEGYNTYAGRKGFEKLMREAGQDFKNISRWLGHQDIRRTEKNYREAEAVEYDAVK